MEKLKQPYKIPLVIPFPQVRRRRLIANTATRLANLPARTAEKLLAAALRRQATSMSRKGVPADLVERECRALETAIRSEIWRAAPVPENRA